MKGRISCMGISPRREHRRTHRPGVCFPKASLANYGHYFHLTLLVTKELVTIVALPSASSAALHRTCSRKMSLKQCVFGCEGKITLFSFPKNPTLRQQWMQFNFVGQQQSFTSFYFSCNFGDREFSVLFGPVRRWICTSFDTERWSCPSDKRSRS